MSITASNLRRFALAFLAFATIWSAGCVRSVQPILKDEQCITDASLTGEWVEKNGERVQVALKDKDAKTYSIDYTDKEQKSGSFVGRFGVVGKLSLIEITPEEPSPSSSDVYKAHLLPLHSFLLVKQTTPLLIMQLLSPDWIKKYLDAHPQELAAIHPDKDSVLITASTDDLQAFIVQHSDDEGFWSENFVLVRPGDPATKPAATQAAGK